MTTIRVELTPELEQRLSAMQKQLDALTDHLIEKSPYWTVEDVANHIRCNEDTVRRKARKGEFRVVRRDGNRMLFDPKDFKAA